jgi:HEAT repeat protein
MSRKQDNPSKTNLVTNSKSSKVTISSLIADLGSEDGIVRVKARQQLVDYRGSSIAPLIKALSNDNYWVRWEAAKSLSQIGSSSSIQALLNALEDKMFDVRWLAAEGLIRIGRKTIVPILEALVKNSNSSWLCEGSHHVLHDMNKGNLGMVLRPVLLALEDTGQSLQVPLVARATLDALTKKPNQNQQLTINN